MYKEDEERCLNGKNPLSINQKVILSLYLIKIILISSWLFIQVAGLSTLDFLMS